MSDIKEKLEFSQNIIEILQNNVNDYFAKYVEMQARAVFLENRIKAREDENSLVDQEMARLVRFEKESSLKITGLRSELRIVREKLATLESVPKPVLKPVIPQVQLDNEQVETLNNIIRENDEKYKKDLNSLQLEIETLKTTAGNK